MIGVLLQGMVAAACFVLPGLWLVQRLDRGAARRLPAAYRLSLACLVSSLLVAAYQSITLHLLPVWGARTAAWLYLVVVAGGTLAGGWRACRSIFAGLGTWELRTWVFLGGLFLIWLALMPLSPYPAQLTVGLVDRPIYYRLAENLVRGRGWLQDVFWGAFAGGTLPYLFYQPLPILATTFLFQIFGGNDHSLSVYCVLTGVLHVGLLARFVARAAAAKQAGRVMIVAALLSLSVPVYVHLIGIGVTTVPGALAFLLLIVCAVDTEAPPAWRRTALAWGMAFMLVVRPEAAILAVLFAVLYPLGSVIFGVRRPVRQRAILLGTLLAVAAVGWWKLPAIARNAPEGMRNLSIFYMRYEPARNSFVPMYSPWWLINQEIVRANFSVGGDTTMPRHNEDIAEEIRSHPLAFAEYVRSGFASAARRSIAVFRIDSYLAWRPAMTVLVSLIILFAFVDPRNAAALSVVLANMAILPLINMGYAARHMLTFVPVLYALFARTIVARPRWAIQRVMLTAAGALIALNVLEIALIRRDWFNRKYTPLLTELTALVEPGDVVATSYPPLIANEIDCATVGGAWLVPNLPGLIERYAPDMIVVDDYRKADNNYILLEQRDFEIPGYTLVRHAPEQHYAIYRKEERDRQNSGRKDRRRPEVE